MSRIYTDLSITEFLRHFIAEPESGGDYDIVWGGIKAVDHPTIPITAMTCRQVWDWQQSIDHKYMSEAAGAYQILQDTLEGLLTEAHCPIGWSDTFNKTTQDTLAVRLLERRGLQKYLDGEMSLIQFCQNLSKEWASLPAQTFDARGRSAKGQSYYAGDGLNKAHVTIKEVQNAAAETKRLYDSPPAPTSIITTLINIILAFFGKEKR